MNLPPSLIVELRSAGFAAVHWSEVGDHRATDATVLKWAHDNQHVLVTHDLDFAALLAAGGQTAPSVIQLRTRDLRPTRRDDVILATYLASRADYPLTGDADLLALRPNHAILSAREFYDQHLR